MEYKRVSSITKSAKELDNCEVKDYKMIMNNFMKKLVYRMIRDGVKVKLPSRLGSLQIVKYKPNKNSSDKSYAMVNFHETNKLREQGIDKIVKHRLFSTDGYWWRLHWFRSKDANFKNKNMLSVKFCRPVRRPNSYNKNNPKLSVVPYFREVGYKIYREFTF